MQCACVVDGTVDGDGASAGSACAIADGDRDPDRDGTTIDAGAAKRGGRRWCFMFEAR